MTLTHANEVHTYMNNPNEENPTHTQTQKKESKKQLKSEEIKRNTKAIFRSFTLDRSMSNVWGTPSMSLSPFQMTPEAEGKGKQINK